MRGRSRDGGRSRPRALSLYARGLPNQRINPDLVDTVKAHPCRSRCEDCAVRLCERTICRSCSEVRSLLPRFLSCAKGRAHVRELLAEIDALDGRVTSDAG